MVKKAAKDREDYENLIFTAVSADLTSYDESIRALNDACEKHSGKAPDFIFCCAGNLIMIDCFHFIDSLYQFIDYNIFH